MGVPSSTDRLGRLAPAIFVLLWSTGFVGTQWGLPATEPFTFLLLRLTAAAALLALVVVGLGLRWPPTPEAWGHAAVTGLLLNGLYLGGATYAIARGVPASVVAAIVSLQPVVTTVLVPVVLGEQVHPLQWTGLGVGLVGVLVVIAPLGAVAGARLDAAGLAAAAFALVAATAGTLYQKRHGDKVPLAGGATVQYLACVAVLAVLAPLSESMRVQATPAFAGALAWLVIGLSVGGVLLFLLLLRRGSAVRVSSLLFLVPPATMLEAWLLLGDPIAAYQVAGMLVASAGVALVVRGGTAPLSGPTLVPRVRRGNG